MDISRNVVIGVLLLLSCNLCICQAAFCGDGWSQYRGHCYFVASQKASWSEAASNCTQMNSTLTSIIDEDEQGFIVNISKQNVKYWIGLKINISKDNCCQWVDGSQSSWSAWASEQPNKKNTCTILKNNTWITKNCDSKNFKYICKKDDPNYFVSTSLYNNLETATSSKIERDKQTSEYECSSPSLVSLYNNPDTTTVWEVEGDKLTSESKRSSSSLAIAVSVSVSLIVLVGLAVLLIVLWLKRRKKRTPHRDATVQENIYAISQNESSAPQMEMSPSNSEGYPTTSDVTVGNDGRHDNSQGQTDPNQSTSNQDVTELYAVVRKKPRTSIDFQMQDNPNYASFGDQYH